MKRSPKREVIASIGIETILNEKEVERGGGKNIKVENGTGNKVIEWTKWIERKESQRAGNNTSERQSLFFWAFSPFDLFF